MPPTITTIDHIHIFVADRAAAERWYGRVLGLVRSKELEFWAQDGGPLTMQNPQGRAHLALFERAAQPCRSTLALSVDAQDFLPWRDHLQACLGKPLEAVDHQISWSLYFTDPDGNPFEITSYGYEAIKFALARSR